MNETLAPPTTHNSAASTAHGVAPDRAERKHRDLAMYAFAGGLLALCGSIYPIYDLLAIPLAVAAAVTALVALLRRSGSPRYALIGLGCAIVAAPIAAVSVALYLWLGDALALGLRMASVMPWLLDQ